jgi:hypothetical protein
LDHISKVLAFTPAMFEADQMWKRTAPNVSAAMRREDLNIYFVTRMNDIGKGAWEGTLKREWGHSPFTGKDNWADGSEYVSEPFSFPLYSYFVADLCPVDSCKHIR